MSEDTFQRVGRFGWGYAPDEVDEFLAKAKVAYSDPGVPDFTEQTAALMLVSLLVDILYGVINPRIRHAS